MALNVLIACEESQESCKAFRLLGHNAYSCDILDCSGGHPEWHFGDKDVKSTCLWLKNLPCLIPDCLEKPEIEYKEWLDKKGRKKRQSMYYYKCLNLPADERQKARSKTYPGIAKAFSIQWSKAIEDMKEGVYYAKG